MSNAHPESFDEFLNGDWYDGIDGFDDSSSDDDLYPSSKDDPPPLGALDIDLQQEIILSHIQWEHIESISKRLDVYDFIIASVLNERGVAFYPTPYQCPWERWTPSLDDGERDYLATECITPEYVDILELRGTELISASAMVEFPLDKRAAITDNLSPSDKRRLIRYVTGAASDKDAGWRMAHHLRDYRMMYLIALQRRDALSGLEALNAQSMQLQGPFAVARSMLLDYFRPRLAKHLLSIFEAWLSLATSPQTTLADLDIPDEKSGIDIDRELLACIPAFKDPPMIVKVILAIGRRNIEQLEKLAELEDKTAKWYCVDRSVRAIKTGDSYRCELEWAQEVAKWRPDIAETRDTINAILPVGSCDLTQLINERLAGDFVKPWPLPRPVVY